MNSNRDVMNKDKMVAQAAPATPSPNVYMKIGSSTILIPAPNDIANIALFTLPSLRSIAFAMFTKNMIRVPANIILA
ncbi:hypothetical protein ES703_124384 [subsurface metagenome]